MLWPEVETPGHPEFTAKCALRLTGHQRRSRVQVVIEPRPSVGTATIACCKALAGPTAADYAPPPGFSGLRSRSTIVADLGASGAPWREYPRSRADASGPPAAKPDARPGGCLKPDRRGPASSMADGRGRARG